MIAATISAGAIAITGAHMNKNLCASGGTKSSLNMNFSASAKKCVMPHALKGPMLARFGPRRSCIIADCRRSIHVRIDARPMPNPNNNAAILARAARIVNAMLP